MREIKFRTWYAGSFHYWGFVGFNNSKEPSDVVFSSPGSSSKEPLSTMEFLERTQQFTGLKDKGGKEIYEGDILSARFAHVQRDPVSGPVIFNISNDYCGFSIRFPILPNAQLLRPALTDASEIIGNIYENPEFMTPHACFSGSTIVKMADGTVKSASALKAGEKVLTYSGPAEIKSIIIHSSPAPPAPEPCVEIKRALFYANMLAKEKGPNPPEEIETIISVLSGRFISVDMDKNKSHSAASHS